MPARLRRWLSASHQPLFERTHDSDWSCTAAVIRCPNRDRAEAVTGSIRPPPGRLILVSPVSGMNERPKLAEFDHRLQRAPRVVGLVLRARGDLNVRGVPRPPDRFAVTRPIRRSEPARQLQRTPRRRRSVPCPTSAGGSAARRARRTTCPRRSGGRSAAGSDSCSSVSRNAVPRWSRSGTTQQILNPLRRPCSPASGTRRGTQRPARASSPILVVVGGIASRMPSTRSDSSRLVGRLVASDEDIGDTCGALIAWDTTIACGIGPRDRSRRHGARPE